MGKNKYLALTRVKCCTNSIGVVLELTARRAVCSLPMLICLVYRSIISSPPHPLPSHVETQLRFVRGGRGSRGGLIDFVTGDAFALTGRGGGGG